MHTRLVRTATRFATALAGLALTTVAACALTFQGITPGESRRADAEAKLGAPVATVRAPNLQQYSGAAFALGDIFVDYGDTGIVDRVDVYFTTPVERRAVASALGVVGNPTASDVRGTSIDEYYADDGVVLTYATADRAGGVVAVSYGVPAIVTSRAIEVLKGVTVANAKEQPAGPGVGDDTTVADRPAACNNPEGSDGCTISTGTILDYFPITDPAQCKAACLADERCAAWAFIKPNGFVQGDPPMCYRDSTFEVMAAHPCCITGWKDTDPSHKTDGPPPPDVDSADPGGSIRFEASFDRPGQDYDSFDLAAADPGLCAARCATDKQCRAFTYVNPGVQGPAARCWLKNGVPEGVERDCCVSGVKGE